MRLYQTRPRTQKKEGQNMQSAKAVNRYKMSCHAGHSRYLFGSGGLPTLVALLLSARHLVAFVRGRAGLDRRVSLDPGRRVLLIGSVEGSGGYVSQASQSMRVSRCKSKRLPESRLTIGNTGSGSPTSLVQGTHSVKFHDGAIHVDVVVSLFRSFKAFASRLTNSNQRR